MAKGGPVEFSISANNEDLIRKLKESRQALLDSGKTAQEQGAKIEGMFKRMAAGVGIAFTAQQAFQFAKQIAVVRGEFQQLDVAFTTLLQSKQKADVLMGEMVNLAMKTPFKLTEVATGAKQLIAYGFAAEDVTGTLTRLGNIASGLGLPMERLTYLYGTTMTQGRLYARDLMQFTTSGIPMLQGLADMFGVSTEEVNKMVTAGKVGFPEVQKVIENLTNSGGKFYNLMEEQSKTITGKISNLGDAIDVMFNKMGQSQEGVINGAIDSAKYLVENYEAVGREIGALVVAYGVYKAAVMTSVAVSKTVTAIHLTQQATELQKLLTVEQRAKISKLNLSKNSAEYVGAVKAEVLAEMEKQTQLAVTTKEELELSRVKLISAEETKKNATETVAVKQAELTAIIGVEKAEQIAAIEKKIAIESEKQSRAALAVVKNNQRKEDMIAAVQEMQLQASLGAAQGKDVSAINNKIAAKQKEIAVISNKITASRAEEIQHSRNIVSLRAEKTAINDTVTSKQVSKVQTELDTAQQQLNTATINKNTLAREVSSKRGIIDSAVRKAESLEVGINTASQTVNAASTGFLSVAKAKLTIVTAKLNAVIAANPYMLTAIAVAALAYGIYKLVTAQTAAERAQERFNEKLEEGKKKQDEFIGKTNELIGVIRTETNTRYMQTKAFKELNEMYPEVLKNMTLEQILLMDNLELQRLFNEDRERKGQKGNVDSLEKAQKQYDKVRKDVDDYKEVSNIKSDLNVPSFFSKPLEDAKIELDNLKKIKKEQDQIIEESKFPEVKIIDLKQNIATLKSQLEEIDGTLSGRKPTEIELFRIGGLNKELSEAHGQLKTLETVQKKSETKNKAYWDNIRSKALEGREALAPDEKGSEKWKAFTKEIEKADKMLAVYNDKTKGNKDNKAEEERLKAIEAYNDAELQQKKQTLDAEAALERSYITDSIELIEFDRNAKLNAIEEERKAYVKLWTDRGIKPENINTSFFDRKEDVVKNEANNEIVKEIQVKVVDGNNSMNDYLAKWGDYNEKRLAIKNEYDKKIAEATNQWEKKNLGKERDSKIQNINVSELTDSTDWETLFGNIEDASTKSLNIVIENLKINAKSMLDAGKLTTEEYFKILDQIGERESQLQKRNPISSLISSAKGAFKPIDREGKTAEDIKKEENAKRKSLREFGVDVGATLDMMSQATQGIIPIADALGANEETKQTLSEVVDVLSGAGTLAKGIATGDVGSIITGGLGMISGLFSLFDGRTKRADKAIKQEQKNIDTLKRSYNQLGREVEKALGTEHYKKQVEQAKNQQAQIEAIDRQIAAERSKKKKKQNQEQIQAWEDEQKELAQQIRDTKQGIIDELSTTDLKSYSSDLSSSIVDGLISGAEGIDGVAGIIDGKMDDLIKNMIAKQFDMLVVQEKMKSMFEAMEKGFGENSEDGFGLSKNELQAIKDAGVKGKEGVMNSIGDLEDVLNFMDVNNSEAKKQSATSKGFETMSQEEGSELKGTFLSMRNTLGISNEMITRMNETATRMLARMNEGHTTLIDVKGLVIIAVEHLDAISKNTFQLHEMNKRLGNIETYTSRL